MPQVLNNKRVAKNTIYLYIRMLLVMLVSLYTARIMLEALGIEDYGLNNVVGGVITLFTFLNSSMTTTTSRYLTYELGRGNITEIRKTFSNSFLTHVILALIVTIFGETIGIYIVNNVLNIPDSRLLACNIVFQFVLLTAWLNIVQVPFSAILISNEKMELYAYMGIFDVVAKLIICYMLKVSSYDKLIMLSILQWAVSFIIFMCYYVYCKREFRKMIYISKKIDKSILKSMLSFTTWGVMGSFANMLKNQGINILMNLFFGSIVNTANGIAYRINAAVMGFTSNFTTALNPQITKSYASGDYEAMRKLIYRGGKFSFFMLMLLGLPLIFEIDFVLKLWLGTKNIPPYTSFMTQLVLILSMVETFTYTIGCAIQATGKIKYYQLVVSGISLMNFPIAYIAFKLGAAPYTALLIALIIAIVALLSRLYFMKVQLFIDPYDYAKEILGRVCIIAVVASIVPLWLCFLMNDGWMRFFVVCMVTELANMICIWFLGVDKNEKDFIKNSIKKILKPA